MTVNKKAQRILKLAMKINNTPTEREITGDKPTVFVQFSGHVNLLNVQIHLNGWIAQADADYNYRLYLSDNDFIDEEMNKCIAHLKQIWQQYKPAYSKEPAQIKEVQANAV